MCAYNFLELPASEVDVSREYFPEHLQLSEWRLVLWSLTMGNFLSGWAGLNQYTSIDTSLYGSISAVYCVSQVGARTLTSLWPRSFTLLWREDTEWVDLTTLLTTCMTHRSPSHVLHVLHMSGWSPASVAVYQSCSDTFKQQLFFYNETFVSLNPLIRLLNLNSYQTSIQKFTVWLFQHTIVLISVTYGNHGIWWGRERNHGLSYKCYQNLVLCLFHT